MNTNLLAVTLTLSSMLPAWAQPGRLGDNVRPLRQGVQLRTDPAQARYSGATEIVVKVTRATNSFRLHALDVQIKKAVLNGKLLKVEAQSPMVLLTSPRLLAPGQYRLQLEFAAHYNTHSVGLYKFRDGQVPYLSTQFEMAEARRCFPCFDEPGFKIPFQMTVAAPSNQRVIANAPQLKENRKGGWTTHVFAPTPPMPSYLVALAVGPYDSVAVPGMSVPGRILAPKGKIALAGFSRKNTIIYIGEE